MSVQVSTKMKIAKPAHDVFEALFNPVKIGNFWFSSGSARWEPGKVITLKYAEYGAQGDIEVIAMEDDRKIVFKWGATGEGRQVVTITLTELAEASTVIAVTQEGWQEGQEGLLAQVLDNKEGWVYTLTCLKAYLEFGVTNLRASLVKH
jgi:uncharacterized protein YndB with AHSA1/START domain